MSYYLIAAATALIASFLTFFSGFGLGTILMPVFALFFGLELGIAMTAVVHLLNNLFKIILVYKNIHLQTLLRFGIPSLLAALAGAAILKVLALPSLDLYSYNIRNATFTISITGILVGVLVIFFALVEMLPSLSNISFSKKHMVAGGFVSGFFGGLTGHQGALRSAFLLRSGLSKEEYVATGVSIAILVDVARLSLYSNIESFKIPSHLYSIMLVAIGAAWTGALLGNYLFKKTSLTFFKAFVGIFMILTGILMCAGVIH